VPSAMAPTMFLILSGVADPMITWRPSDEGTAPGRQVQRTPDLIADLVAQPRPVGQFPRDVNVGSSRPGHRCGSHPRARGRRW
jgi:hypothetical protein